jgi:hypothetical protein
VTGLRGTVLVLALLIVSGCGSSGTKARRDSVNAYFAQVAKAQIGLLSNEGQIDSTLQAFSLTRSTPAERVQLQEAKRDVEDALRRVRALQPPPDARKLDGLIVRRLEVQDSVVDELIATAAYIPKLAATAPLLQAAVVGLRRDLAAVATGTGAHTVRNGSAAGLEQDATAFGDYGDALKPVSTVLEGLTAPPILSPALNAERQAVKRSITLCATIRRTLLHRDIAGANAAIHSLFSISTALNGAQTAKRQAAAARAYDARLRQIDALAKKVNLERDRLVKVIG